MKISLDFFRSIACCTASLPTWRRSFTALRRSGLRATGHGSFEITKRHYVEPTVLAGLKQRKASSALESPASSRATALSQLSEALKNLSAAELAHILRTVGTPR